MICARIESLILEQGMEDALARAYAFTHAGADAIIYSAAIMEENPELIAARASGHREAIPAKV